MAESRDSLDSTVKSLCEGDLCEVQEELYAVRTHWYNLGLKLGLKPDVLDAIETQCSADPSRCFRETLKNYLKTISPSWRALVGALRSPTVDKPQLAEKLEKKFCSAQQPAPEVMSETENELRAFALQTSTDSALSTDEQHLPNNCGCGCGRCSFDSVLKNGCPKPILSLSSFSYLNTEGLDESQTQILRGRLYHEFEVITTDFGSLVYNTCDSLIKQGTTVQELVRLLMTVGALQPTLRERPLLEDRIEELQAADSIDKVFFILRGYISFFSYHIIEYIISKIGTRQDKENLRNYTTKLKDYSRRTIFECPTYSLARKDHANLVVKIEGANLERYNLIHLETFKSSISNIIKVTKYTLRLCNVKDGCLELTFQMPHFVKEVIFPLTSTQKAALKAKGVIRLTCEDYQCLLEEAAPPEVSESLGTSLSAMAELPNPKRCEITENGKLKLLPKVFVVYAHNPGEYLQIRPPNVDEVMRKDPSMTRELIQQRYEREKIQLSTQTEENIRKHKLLVREFSDFLQSSGVAVAYDQLLADTGTDNLMRWTEQQIEDSDYVILIVTPSLREFLTNPSYASRDEEYIFSGHTLYNLIHSPPSRPNSPLGLGVLCFLPVFLESTKNLGFLPKTLEAGSCYEIWKPFDVQRPQGDDLVSLYTLLTRQSVCPPPAHIGYVPIRPKKRFGDGVIDPSAMTQEQRDVHRQLSACSQQLSDRAFRELAYKAEFAAEWERLASKLGLGEAEVERIGGSDNEEACLKMLRRWKETQGEATVAGLVEAILKIRNFPLLQLLYRVYRL